MIRKWQPTDLAVVADVILRLQKIATWSHDLAVDQEELAKWLLGLYTNPRVTVFLDENEEQLVSTVIGVRLDNYYLPPHFTYVEEWILWGEDNKSIVNVWREARQWGKDHAAMYAKRGVLDGKHEHIKWEQLR